MSFPKVTGNCPACGSDSLFLASGGYVTCSRAACPDSGLAADMLENPYGPAPDVHAFFGLSYANYLVLNRTLLQSMPDVWQRKLVWLLERLDAAVAAAGIQRADQYEVRAREFSGRFCADPVPHYDRGRTLLPLEDAS